MKIIQARFANQVGRTMVEMLGVLAVISVLSLGGLSGYSAAMKKNKLNQTEEQVLQIISNFKSKFALTKRAGITTLPEAIKMGIFPQEMVKSETSVENNYKGSVNFEKIPTGGVPSYKLSFSGLPEDVASSLVLMNIEDGSYVFLVELNGQKCTPSTVSSLLRDSNTVTWYFN